MTTSGLDPVARRLRVSLGGAIDIATAADAFAAVIDAQPPPGVVVQLDMSGVTFMDSSGLAMLLRVRQYLDGMGGRLTLVNPSVRVMRVLTVAGVTEYLPIEDE